MEQRLSLAMGGTGAMASTKMGCPEVGDPVGGLGVARDALERACDGERWPAAEVKFGRKLGWSCNPIVTLWLNGSQDAT